MMQYGKPAVPLSPDTKAAEIEGARIIPCSMPPHSPRLDARPLRLPSVRGRYWVREL